MEPFDPTKPNIARVWDFWLGGKDNFAADRDLAQKMLAVHPPTAQMARENRQFLGRAVSYVANRGIRQFIDVGAGLPTAVNTHDIARHIDPQAHVAYVDNDPRPRPSRRRAGPPLDWRQPRPEPGGPHRYLPGRRRPQALIPRRHPRPVTAPATGDGTHQARSGRLG